MSVFVIICAAGSGTRMGADKLALPLGGRSVLWRAVNAFACRRDVERLAVAVRPDRAKAAAEELAEFSPLIVEGGATRSETVRRAFAALDPPKGALVAVHDGARPFVGEAELTEVFAKAGQTGAAILAVPLADTVHSVADGIILGTPERSSLAAAQTPQVFEASVLAEVLGSGAEATDEAALVAALGHPVSVVWGARANRKLTTPEDLPPAEPQLRVGHGYDAHRLVEGRALVLGGVTIPHEKGLLGHSDADVLVHAVIDALLGAAAAGDIGALFPDSSPEFEGISSLELLRRAKRLLPEACVINADATVLCQAPKLRPYIGAMRANIAAALGTGIGNVSVKATTEEGMGFSGRKEGIAAHAVTLIKLL